MKIYVSSTFEDLKEFRAEVYRQLRKLRADAAAMEDYVASEKRPLAKCLEDVADSDIYVGIFAWRYGYIPKERGNPESRSITELEYRTAGQHSKERLIFLLREDAPWKPSLMDAHAGEGDGGKQIERLREELRTSHTVSFFSTPDELAKEVSAAVANVLLRPVVQLHVGDGRSPATGSQPISTGSVHYSSHGFFLTWYAYCRGSDAAHSVGRIEDVEGKALASGFLVSGVNLHQQLGSELYLLTPGHVIAREKTQGSFNLTVDQARFRLTIPYESEEPIRLTDIVWSSPVDALDLSVIRLQRQPRGASGLTVADRLPVLTSTSGSMEAMFGSSNEPVILIGHPKGGELAFSLGGMLLAYDDTQLQYVAETEAGSAGSPVLNRLWRVIGVHRLRGDIALLNGQGKARVCQAVSLLAVRQALNAQLG